MSRRILAIAAIVLLAAGMLGCNAKKQKSAGEEICARYLPAVVEIKTTDNEGKTIGCATGTVIDGQGAILTNRHVVRRFDYQLDEYLLNEKIYVRFYNEDEYAEAMLVAVSDEHDLALLRIDKATDCFMRVGGSEDLRFGENVHTIGNGNGYGLAYAGGSVAAALRNIVYEGLTIEAVQLALNMNEGNSGGPLINDEGELVGIITFRLRDSGGNIIYGTSFALTTKSINQFLSIAAAA